MTLNFYWAFRMSDRHTHTHTHTEREANVIGWYIQSRNNSIVLSDCIQCVLIWMRPEGKSSSAGGDENARPRCVTRCAARPSKTLQCDWKWVQCNWIERKLMIQKWNSAQVNGGKVMWNLKKGTKLSTCSDWIIQQRKRTTGNDIAIQYPHFPMR